MVMTSPAITRRAPATGTPLTLTRLSLAASNSHRPDTARRLAWGVVPAVASSWSERMAPVVESNTTRAP
jgi:hypothetical protein